MLSKIFTYDFVVSQIPSMIKIADMTFDSVEQKYWRTHPELKEKRELKAKIYDMMTQYTSNVMISGFLGTSSLTE